MRLTQQRHQQRYHFVVVVIEDAKSRTTTTMTIAREQKGSWITDNERWRECKAVGKKLEKNAEKEASIVDSEFLIFKKGKAKYNQFFCLKL